MAPPSRTDARSRGARRGRPVGILIGLGVGVAVGLVLVLVVRGGSGRSTAGPAAGPARAAPGSLRFTVSGTDVQAVGAPAPGFPPDVQAKVLATLNRYLADAVGGPLRSGRAAGDLAPVFTAPALARVTGPDRPALVDEGLPKAPSLRTEVATARLRALLGAGNEPQAVSAAVELRVRTGGSDAVTVARTGSLILVPDGAGWKIDGYDITTARDTADGPSTTTARR